MNIFKREKLYHFLTFIFLNRFITGVHSIQTNHLLAELFNIRNTTYQKLLDDLALPKRQSFEIALEHGTRAQVQLLLPPSWREELRDAAFPVLVEV